MLDLFERLDKLSFLNIFIGNSYGFAMLVGNIASVVLYLYCDSNYEVPEEWLAIIQTKCPDLKPGEQNPILQSFEYSMISAATFGTLLGISFEAKVFGSNKYKSFNQTSTSAGVLRLVIMIGGQLPFLYLGTVIPKAIFEVLGVDQDTRFAVQRGIALATGYFYAFGISRYLCYRLGLINTST